VTAEADEEKITENEEEKKLGVGLGVIKCTSVV